MRGGIDDKIVRLMIRDVPRHIARELDHKAIRDYKRRALNFHLDLRRPDTLRLHAAGSPGRRPSLNEIVREKLMARPLDADVDRGVLVERAMAYLDEAQAVAHGAADAARRLMRLHSLHLCNFRQHVDTHIEFETGITGIIGPNGSGKSTILEAIAWALYGMPAARGTRESIRSYRAGPRATVKVELDFELAGHRYFVSRGLNNAEVYLDGATSPIATSISGVTDLLRRRLGMSHDEFFNTYFTGQNELSVMAAMGPAERAQFLSRVLGYERLRTAQELVRDRRKAIIAETTGLRAGDAGSRRRSIVLSSKPSERRDGDRGARQRSRRSAASRRSGARRGRIRSGRRSSATATRCRRSCSETARRGRRARVDRARGRCASIASSPKRRRRARSSIARRASSRRSRRSRSELAGAGPRGNEEGRRRTLSETSARAGGGDRAPARAAREDRDGAGDSRWRSRRTARRARARARADAARFRERCKPTGCATSRRRRRSARRCSISCATSQPQRDQIVELGESGTCPICARPLETHFRTVLEVLDTQIETITVDGKYYRARIEQLAEMPPEVKRARRAARAVVRERRKARAANRRRCRPPSRSSRR